MIPQEEFEILKVMFNSLTWNMRDREEMEDFQQKNFNDISGKIEIDKIQKRIDKRTELENIVISLKRWLLLGINFAILVGSIAAIISVQVYKEFIKSYIQEHYLGELPEWTVYIADLVPMLVVNLLNAIVP